MRKGTAIKRIDLTNHRFGKLVVEEMLYGYKTFPNSRPRTYCKCKCDCGNTKIILVSNLKKGATKSCGCLEKSSRYDRVHFIDLTGQKFGKLTVINKEPGKASNGSALWNCLCECGNYRIVSAGDLRRGHFTHCGCENFKSVTLDLTGERFGYLTAIEPARKNGINRTAWKCKCDCGNEVIVTTDRLRGSNTTSCGKCFQKKSYHEVFIENILIEKNVLYYYNYFFDDCRSPDKNRKLPFDFYLPNLNTAIEYDGMQHVKSVPAWGGKAGLERRKFLDSIKTQYCMEHHIRLIRIPHTYNFNEIKQAVLNILDPATTTAM